MRKSPYYETIREMIAKSGNIGIDPRQVEAFIRLEHPTMDHLSEERLMREVQIGCQCVKEAGPQMAEEITQSFGL